MKRNILFKLFGLGLLALSQSACENAEYESVDNLIYINEASSAKAEEVTLQDEGSTRTSVTVRLAKALDHDVTAELFLDEEALAAYNKKNETVYKAIAAEHVTFPKEVKIAAGSVSANPINIDIASFEAEGGAQYALPIAIRNANGIAKAEASSSFLLVLVKPLKQPVPKFTYANAMQAAPEGNWGLSLTNYTLEWWVKMSNFSINNQAIFDSGSGDSELYIRFGDLVYSNQSGSGYLNNFLQVKTMGGQFDTGDPNTSGLEANVWYHFAITYDAASGTSTLYKNGTAIASLTSAVGQPMIINKLQMVSSGQQYFRDNCELCQVRLWNVTRTANQIKKNMYKEVNYTDKNLILYLPMNEGEGNTTLKDVTGNGHDVQVGNMSSNGSSSFTWATYSFAQ